MVSYLSTASFNFRPFSFPSSHCSRDCRRHLEDPPIRIGAGNLPAETKRQTVRSPILNAFETSFMLHNSRCASTATVLASEWNGFSGSYGREGQTTTPAQIPSGASSETCAFSIFACVCRRQCVAFLSCYHSSPAPRAISHPRHPSQSPPCPREGAETDTGGSGAC